MDVTQTQKPKKTPPKNNDSFLEQFRDIGSGVSKTVGKDLFQGVAQDALSSLFNTPKRSGELKAGQALDLSQPPAPPPQPETISPFKFPKSNERFPMPPFRRKEAAIKPAVSQETMNMLREQEALVQKKIEDIRMEVKSLISELKQVDKEIQRTVATQFVDPGVYHINFLDRLKETLKVMLLEMRQSKNWLQVGKSRKRQKGYWSMAKKKGTEWTLNNERSVATQTG